MILAAGLGTRLRPFSNIRPKPLFPVLNQPLLYLTIKRLRRAGFKTIVVNAHHLRDQMKSALQGMKGVILQQEDQILGTGGGIRQALTHFDSAPVLIVNGDIYHTIDYAQVYKDHCRSGGQVTLVCHDYPRFNNVYVDERHRVILFHAPTDMTKIPWRRLAFTGIHIVNPAVLLRIPPDRFSNIIDGYRDLLQEGVTINSLEMKNIFWSDIGSLTDYLSLHEGLLTGLVPPYKEIRLLSEKTPFCVAENASIGRGVEMKDWTCVGANARIGNNTLLERVVVWPGADIPAGTELHDTVAT